MRVVAVASENHATEIETIDTNPLTADEKRHLRAVIAILKLLHMAEFYVLIEFAEFAIAGFYAVYLAMLSHLPNRVFYSQFSSLTDEQLTAKTLQVMYYALLELLSSIVFSAVMDGILPRFSSWRQLGFALHRHWRMVQSSIISWSFMVLQITLEHFGTDFTFQFKWLSKKN